MTRLAVRAIPPSQRCIARTVRCIDIAQEEGRNFAKSRPIVLASSPGRDFFILLLSFDQSLSVSRG